MSTAIKHLVPDRVKPSFVIFDIRALWRLALIITVPGCQKFLITAQPCPAQDALWCCMATVGIKGLMYAFMYWGQFNSVVLFTGFGDIEWFTNSSLWSAWSNIDV